MHRRQASSRKRIRDAVPRRARSGARTAAETLRESEERFANAFRFAPIGMAVLGADGYPMQVNQSLCEMLGYSEEELLQRHFRDLTHPDDLAADEALMRRLISGESETYQIEKRYLHKQGRIVWGRLSVVLARSADGSTPRYGIVQVEDITDRKAAEQALRESEQQSRTLAETSRANEARLQAMLDMSPDIMCRVHQDGTILDIRGGEALRDGLGGSIGRNVTDFNAPEDREAVLGVVQQALATGQMQTFETKLLGPDGVRYFESRVVPWAVDEVISSVRETTERRRAEEEARQRQSELAHLARLDTMGEMAAALAHEVNQPLSAIVSFAKGCTRRMQTGTLGLDELAHIIEQMATQALRAGEIIRRLRRFARKEAPQRELVELNALVREAVCLAEVEARQYGIPLRVDLEAGSHTVEVDSVLIVQVVVNLIRNGIQAMSGEGGAVGGELSVRTALGAGGMIEVAVSDRGPGMKGVGEDGHEAFFSTKEGGLGMGLPISRSILKAHGGRLWFTADPVRGTTFRFALPVADGG